MEAIGRSLKLAAEISAGDSLGEVAAVCRDLLVREGLPGDMRTLIWTPGSTPKWQEVPAELQDVPPGHVVCRIDGAAERDLIRFDSPAGYAARILGVFWRLERARENGDHRQAEGLAFKVGGLVMEAHHKRLADLGWAFDEGPKRERYDDLARLIRDVLDVDASVKPAQVLLEVISRDERLPLDKRVIEAFHSEADDSEQPWLELRSGLEVTYQAFTARVRRMRRKLSEPEPDAND